MREHITYACLYETYFLKEYFVRLPRRKMAVRDRQAANRTVRELPHESVCQVFVEEQDEFDLIVFSEI